jgi:hypothetical protein
MALKFSVDVRNAKINALEVAIGASAKLYLRTGAPPADCAAADAGTLIGSATLPADWLNDAGAGAKTIKGTWTFTGIAPGGVIAHFRIKDNGDVACHIQGTVSLTGAGGDMTMVNTNIADAQVGTVATFTLTEGNA